MIPDEEERLLRTVATRNAQSILEARQRAEEELIRAKQALEDRTTQLAHSLSLTRATLESTTDGILVTDPHGTVSDFNHKYVAMWGIPTPLIQERRTDAMFETLARQLTDPVTFRARLHDIAQLAPDETFDLMELADGRVFERFSKAQMVSGVRVGRVWSFRDITDRRMAEEALRKAALDNERLLKAAQDAATDREKLLQSERQARAQAERLSELKDEFLATLSHELRTPLSAILGWTQVLRHRRTDADLANGLDTIERNARTQTQLIEDLLDMSRITSGQVRLDVQLLRPVTFVEAALETVRPSATAKGIRLEHTLDPAAGPISGDPARLQQVIWNLLSNSIKFTPPGGKVHVVLQPLDTHIEISVTDTGCGVRAAFLPHVFERFRQADSSQTRRFGGLGLGLSIVKQLVEIHGGTVHASSPGEGLGSTFSVRLPVSVPPQPSYRDASVAKATAPHVDFRGVDLSGVTVLLVDDEADTRNLLERALNDCGAQVWVTGSPEEALRRVQGESLDVMISDIGMPEVDGYELLRRVRALPGRVGARLPAVALTAFARSEDRTRAMRAGFLAHVAKPVEIAELVTVIAAVTGRIAES